MINEICNDRIYWWTLLKLPSPRACYLQDICPRKKHLVSDQIQSSVPPRFLLLQRLRTKKKPSLLSSLQSAVIGCSPSDALCFPLLEDLMTMGSNESHWFVLKGYSLFRAAWAFRGNWSFPRLTVHLIATRYSLIYFLTEVIE